MSGAWSTASRGTFATPSGRYLRQFGTIDDLMGLPIDTRLEIVTPLRRRVEVTSRPACASRVRPSTRGCSAGYTTTSRSA